MSDISPREALPVLTAEGFTRRREWVAVPGFKVCVWELTMEEDQTILNNSQRPAIDPRGGYDRGEMALWQIALSCYNGDGDNAERIWPDQKAHLIRSLPERIGKPLLIAINRINGEDPEEEEILRDFSQATGARSTSG